MLSGLGVMSVDLWGQFVNWLRGNWVYLAAVAGGFVAGWIAKVYFDPVNIPPMPENLRALTERVVQEWRSKGYPEDLIQDAVNWAVMYTRQVVGAWTTNKELVDAFFNAAYPIILQHAGENYILGRLFARIKEEKIGDLIGLK